MTTFKDLGLSKQLVQAVTDLGFESPTPIQEQAVPHILKDSNDLVALAQTGTGKTAAFGLPVLSKVTSKKKNVQAIILCPTRELCMQITKDLQDFAKYLDKINIVAVYGGASVGYQIREVKKGPQIIVGTPGRVQDLINRGVLDITSIEFLVLDEADEMLNMGFKEELDEILKDTPKNKQTLLFSATMPRSIANIAKSYMNNPLQIKVEASEERLSQIQHKYFVVTERNRYEALRRILDFEPNIYGIVFCRTKLETQEIASRLMQDGYPAEATHGDLSQIQRTKVMQRFKKQDIQLLVATDVAARGIDVKELSHVINYNLPDSLETYTHRSGRTGRANETGTSLLFVTPREVRQVSLIQKRTNIEFTYNTIPTGAEIIERQLQTFAQKITNCNLPKDSEYLNDYLDFIEPEQDYKSLALKLLYLQSDMIVQKYAHNADINARAPRNSNTRERRNNKRGSKKDLSKIDFKEITISVGRKSGFNKRDFFRLINTHKSLRGAEIGSIQISANETVFQIEDKLFKDAQNMFAKTKFRKNTIEVA